MSAFNENTVEQATLEWLRAMGYEYQFGPDIAPEEPNAERTSYRDVLHSVDPVAYRDLGLELLDSPEEEAETQP